MVPALGFYMARQIRLDLVSALSAHLRLNSPGRPGLPANAWSDIRGPTVLSVFPHDFLHRISGFRAQGWSHYFSMHGHSLGHTYHSLASITP